jgi:hypothetical protein
MRPDGDFSTDDVAKSANAAFDEYWAYPNGWIAMGAQRMGRFDVSYPAFAYLHSFSHSEQGGFCTGRPGRSGQDGTDALTTAHLGLLCLSFGALERAIGAGRWLARLLELQPDPHESLYLRMDAEGRIVRDFPEAVAAFHVVRAHQGDQAYFMIGYPMAFLGRLYQATGDRAPLDAARGYFDVARECGDELCASHLSHKVGWGAAVLTGITGEERCAELAARSPSTCSTSRRGAGSGCRTSRSPSASTRPRRSPSGCRRSAPNSRGAEPGAARAHHPK